MPATALPSEVVATIDRVFDWAKGYQYGVPLNDGTSSLLIGVAELASTIPSHLITLRVDELAAYLCSVAAIKSSATAYLNADPQRKLQVDFSLSQ